jgi:glyoxylase-like metal-dependent hydrolase (beta-lactamase superfamily II)
MTVQLPLDESDRAFEIRSDNGVRQVAPDLAYLRTAIVNVVFVGPPSAGDGEWLLVDTGLAGTAEKIIAAAAERFADSRPACIVLTHGHFDHVGNLEVLAGHWGVPIFSHRSELPYLTGKESYPSPDTHAGGGLMPKFSRLFPREPLDLGSKVSEISDFSDLAFMADWEVVQTPGHTPGHISLWRESDRALIVGDAFITTGQESVYEVLVQRPEMHGPPRYFTPDWQSAESSVQHLADLEPELVITGHGRAMHGANMRRALHLLADHFRAIALP